MEKKNMKKRSNTADNIDWNHFDISYPAYLKVLMLTAFVFFGAFFIASAGDLIGLWEFGTNNDSCACLFFGAFTLLCAWGVLGTVVWKIRVDGDEIHYRSLSGRTKHYRASEIDRIVLADSGMEPGFNIKVFSQGHCAMKIDGNVAGGPYFIYWCVERNINVEKNDKEFIMQATPFYKGLRLVFVVIAFALFILCVKVEYIPGNVFFAVLTIAALIECIRTWTERIHIIDHQIVRTIVPGKKKTIEFREIEKIAVKNIDNANVYHIYVNGKVVLKISSLYQNAAWFNNLAASNGWTRE